MTDITPIMEALLSLATILITSFLIPYLKTKFSSEKFQTTLQFVEMAVSYAEQIYANKPNTGKEKKNFVLSYLNSKGITYDDGMIEASVLKLK